MTDFKDLASKLIEVAVALTEHSKGLSAQTEAGTATPPETPEKSPPWTKEQVREALGFKPDDERVNVQFKTFGDEITAAVANGDLDPEQDDTANVVYLDGVLEEVAKELEHATVKHGPMTSAHEGYAVLLEEVDELWELVKKDAGYTQAARKEAIQIATMALRYVLDLNPQSVNILRS